MSDDVICQIVRGELTAEIVHRDDALIAFLDHRPVFKGHTLICPVRHVDTMLELPAELMQPLLGFAQRIARAQQDALAADGTFMAMNNVVSQSIPHLHLHVVPRRRKDGLRGFFWPRTRYEEGEAADYGSLIRTSLHGG